MNKEKLMWFFSLIAILFVVAPVTIEAQPQVNKKPIEYKKSRVLQNSTAERMALVYEALEVVNEEGEPAPDMETVLSILNELKDNMANLKSYDRSVMWNAWAYVYFNDGDYPKAIDAYYRLIAEPEVTIGLRVGALYSLAQLHVLEENYEKGIQLIRQWMSEVETVTAQSYAFLGQSYYQTGDFKKALSSMETALMMAEVEGSKPRENWYVIMAASIGEMKKEIGEEESLYRQIDIYETLVDLYPKKEYFIQLGGSYGQLGRERDYMITLKAAYEKNLLNRESEYLALTQLLLLNEDATSALEVFENGQKKMIAIVDEKTEEEKMVPVIKDTEKNLKLLADIKYLTNSNQINLATSQEIVDFKYIETYERNLKDKLINEYKLLHDAWLLEKPIKSAKPVKDVWQKDQEYLEIINIWENEYLKILNIWEDNPPVRISKITKQKLDIKIGCDEFSSYEYVCYSVEDEAINLFEGKTIPIARDFMRENFENISIYIISESSAYSSSEQMSYSRIATNYLILNNEELVKLGDLRHQGFRKPIFAVAPIYPRRAQERGTMGYAIVEFTITETGIAENAVVIEGYCSNGDPNDPSTEFRSCTMFNSASARAALLLEYNPLIFDGQAVRVHGQRYKFTYILDES